LEKPSNVGVAALAEQLYYESLDGRFAVQRAAVPQDLTGERMTPSVTGQVAFEHYHRYCLARDLVAGRDVLDIASGEGYGAAILADVARSVVGVEIDEATVTHAIAAYNAANLRYVQGDALAIPLPDASVDVVVSFETLEHLRDQNRFLLEVRRVLRPNGLFIVSTPDRLVYSAREQAPNPYHLLELSVPEFTVLLERHFSQHRMLAQRTALGSVAIPIDGRSDAWRTYSLHGSETIEARTGLEQAFYLIALASDGALPQIAGSLFTYHVGIDDLLSASAALARARAEIEQQQANATAVAAGCPASPTTRVNTLHWSSPPPMSINTSKKYRATVKTTLGTFLITLFAKQAPVTVNSFVFLAKHNYFHCVIFHRVIPGFMDQTGDPTGTGTGGPGYQFANENIPKAYATGDVAMANSGPNTNGSQFFVLVPGGAPTLDQDLASGGYSLFGKVISGMTVVEKINAEGNSSDNGTPPHVIQRMLSVTVEAS